MYKYAKIIGKRLCYCMNCFCKGKNKAIIGEKKRVKYKRKNKNPKSETGIFRKEGVIYVLSHCKKRYCKHAVDAIVNSANPHVRIGAGRDGTIYRKAGALRLLAAAEDFRISE